MKGSVEDAQKSQILEEIIAVHSLRLAPKYLGNIAAGIKDVLLGYLLKYNEDLKAVPLVFTKADHNLSPVAPILYDNPCAHLSVRVRWLAMTPTPGARVAAQVSLQSPKHLGLLLLNFFNVTIPASQLESVFKWDAEAKCWVNKGTAEQVYLGDSIEFEILSFSNDGGVLLITGSVDRLTESIHATSSPSRTLKSKPQVLARGWQVESISGEVPQEKKKKRKHEGAEQVAGQKEKKSKK